MLDIAVGRARRQPLAREVAGDLADLLLHFRQDHACVSHPNGDAGCVAHIIGISAQT